MSVLIKFPVMKLNIDGRHYFGEVKKENHKYVPYGTGLYTVDEDKFFMSEYVTKDHLAGMTIVGHGYNGFLTYTDDGIFYGPKIKFKDQGDISFELINDEGYKEKVAITLKPDGTYYISQYDKKGNFTNKVISFKKGVFCFEYRLEETKERTAVKERKVGWNFKYPYVRMHLLPFDHTKSVVPARVEEGTMFTYIGGAQTGGLLYGDGISESKRENFNYVSIVNNLDDKYFDYRHPKASEHHNLFTDQSKFGYAVNYYNDGRKYFGEVYDSKFGGVGCIKYNDCDYLGYVMASHTAPDRTGMKVYKNGVIEFGSYVCFNDLIFEIHDDYMFIKSYHEHKLRGLYYKLYFDSFNLEEYNSDNKLLDKYPFPNITEDMLVDDGKEPKLRTKLSGADFLDNEMRAMLGNFDYYIPKINELDIIGYKNNDLINVYVPYFATRIKKNAFYGKKNIYTLNLPKELKVLDENSLIGMKGLSHLNFHEECKVTEIPTNLCDSPNIYTVTIPKSVKAIREGAFSKCSGLKKAYVYSRCFIESGAFPKKCKIFIIDKELKEDKKVEKENKKAAKIADKKINKKEQVVKKKEVVKKDTKVRETKVRNKVSLPSVDFSGFFGKVLNVIAFPFVMLFRLFKLIGKGIGSLGLRTNVFSVISIVVMSITVLMNFFKVNVTINEWATDFGSTITTWFGFNLTSWVTTLKPAALILYLLIGVLFILTFVADLIINILVLVFLVIYFILFFVVGLAYSIVIPIGMLALAIVGLVQDKTSTNIGILIVDVGLIVLFYIAIYM